MKVNMKPAEVRKFLMAVGLGLSEAVAYGLLEGTAEKVALCVLAALGAYGIYRVPNKPLQ